jgi:hypothetical protein
VREPKVGPSLGLRLATARVNLQLVKLEQHVARPWSADAERIARIDGAVLDAWSRRETSAYLTDTAEHVVEALDPMVRQTHADILTLVDRIDTVVTTAREGTDRLARWTKVLTIVGTGLLLLSGFQIWLVWLAAMHR